MIITRTPFRVSFAGGGTDLSAFYKHHTGAVFSTAIDKYMYIAAMQRLDKSFRISYSKTELRDKIDDIDHPIVRQTLKLFNIKKGLEIVSMADLPAESGMGSSSSFTVGLLHALHTISSKVVSPEFLASKACEIEIEHLREPIGKQDQYIAAYGGLRFLEFHPSGHVRVEPVLSPPGFLAQLNRRLILLRSGGTRAARTILARQSQNTEKRLETLLQMRDLAYAMRDLVSAGENLAAFGAHLHQGWLLKKTLDEGISSPEIDRQYAAALRAGALGGKLLGAGGGGFLLLYCEPEARQAVKDALPDLDEMPFQFCPEGSKIIHIGGEQY